MNDLSHTQLSVDEPWPGLAWFEEVDQPYFRGRSAETDQLIRLVRREPLTVLFGRSGLGKTSLLKAGLFPALRAEDYLPVYIRLEHSTDAPPLRDQVWTALEAAVQQENVQGVQASPDEELWTFLHRRDAEFWSALNRPVTPVIVLDQFEEIFTLGQEEEDLRRGSEHFLAELADLVENRPPASVKQRLEHEPEAAACYEFRRSPSKLVLSFREDFLAEIERLKTAMPSLMVNRLRLLPMNGNQAYAVVTEAGGHLVDDEVARCLLQLTWRNTPHPPVEPSEFARMEIDPALLSVVCRELNNKRLEVKPPLPRITADLMAGADREILKEFYERGVEGLDLGVRRFVEEELITQQGFRDSHDWEDALLLPGVSQAALDQLISRRLLRGEERQGRRRLELTHDVLTKVVKDSRDSRRDREAAATKAQQFMAAAERERAAETTRSLRTTRRLLWLSGGLFTAVALIGAIAFLQVRKAQEWKAKAKQLEAEVAEKRRADAERREAEAIERAKTSQKQALDLKQANEALKALNQALARQKLKAEALAKVAANREQLAISASRLAETEKEQANAQRKIAEVALLKAKQQKERADQLQIQVDRLTSPAAKSKVLSLFEQRFPIDSSTKSAERRQNLSTLIQLLESEQNARKGKAPYTLTDIQTFAYVLATINYETDGTFRPLVEFGDGESYEGRTDLGNTVPGDGRRYKGRGYVQIVGRQSYHNFNQRLALAGTPNDIVKRPEKILDPSIAFRVLIISMQEGRFTGLKLSDFIYPGKADYLHARRIINGLTSASNIEKDAILIEDILRQILLKEPRPRQE